MSEYLPSKPRFLPLFNDSVDHNTYPGGATDPVQMWQDQMYANAYDNPLTSMMATAPPAAMPMQPMQQPPQPPQMQPNPLIGQMGQMGPPPEQPIAPTGPHSGGPIARMRDWLNAQDPHRLALMGAAAAQGVVNPQIPLQMAMGLRQQDFEQQQAQQAQEARMAQIQEQTRARVAYQNEMMQEREQRRFENQAYQMWNKLATNKEAMDEFKSHGYTDIDTPEALKAAQNSYAYWEGQARDKEKMNKALVAFARGDIRVPDKKWAGNPYYDDNIKALTEWRDKREAADARHKELQEAYEKMRVTMGSKATDPRTRQYLYELSQMYDTQERLYFKIRTDIERAKGDFERVNDVPNMEIEAAKALDEMQYLRKTWEANIAYQGVPPVEGEINGGGGGGGRKKPIAKWGEPAPKEEGKSGVQAVPQTQNTPPPSQTRRRDEIKATRRVANMLSGIPNPPQEDEQ